MSELKNPYIAGAPVTETRMFFGREDVFDWIEKSLSGQYADHILVVHGQRRVGKTSVLKQLGNHLPKMYLPVFFDLQGRTHTTLDRFLWWLARETVRVIKQERGIDVPPPEKELFARDAEYFENVFLHSLYPLLGETRLLYTFDEFDNLDESGVKDELARPLTDYLRRLMGRGEMNFIFSIGSSGRKLENMQAAYTDFFKTALYKKISFLSEEQTHRLVTSPVEGIIEYEPAAVQRIYAIASGHPYFTQLTCHELFARCQFLNQRKITLSDVNAILDDVVERGTVNLKFVWDEASDIERWILASLAHLEKANNRTLADFLHKQRVRCSDSDLNSALLHLREKDVLTTENNFVIHLLRLWLQKNRTIEQVREELTEVNPIANRYIEIGLEFKDSGLFDKAIGSFREALAIAPGHIQAQVNIALTYMSQKSYDKAIAEFEQALKIDDEDISARSGLCEAHLALGDTAMQRNRTREALQSYQRVLSINVEHTEARQRMAELNSQRAEKALADGKDEEALSAFSEALKYTPEDPILIERVKNVREKKKAKVLAEQVARSEKEAASRNWDKAIAALNEALQTAPLDESILKKMDVIKGKQLQEQLDTILSRINLAEKASRWDTAIAGLYEYRQLKPDDPLIQQRIDSLVEAKHAAWLKSITTRVDQAILSQNWPEALTALNEALRLEPDNAEMQAKAAEVDEARRKAELESMLKNADRAAGAGRWDEAIELLNDGLVSYPDNEIIKTKLAQARQAKREARHKAALRLADTAAQAGKWKTAAESLQEILIHEPDNAEFQEKLSEITSLERQSRLNAVQMQAQSLVNEEMFEEALAAWNGYLADEHADRQAALVEMERIKKAQNLASLYAEAAQASARKNYEKAVDLYKSIVMLDADYKNATDLLAETVKLRRTSQKSPKISVGKTWFTRGLLLLLAVGIGGVVFWLGRNGLPDVPALVSNHTAATYIPVLATQKTVSTQPPAPTSDPRVANPANGHLYLYVRAEKSWPAARDYCTERGGYLVTIQDTAENIFVYQLTNGETWLGATDEAEEGIWEWTSGETWNYEHWAEGQPDNDDHGEDGKEPYLTFLEFPGSWNDLPDSSMMPFVCEWVPSPQGKTIMVTSAEDAGAGTLRQALENAKAGDVIEFDPEVFPPEDPLAILLKSPLPILQSGHLTLDASNAGVILDGSQAGGDWTAGLAIMSEYNVIKGFQILHFTGPGILLEAPARFNTVGGDRTAGSGPLGEGNLVGDNADGIALLGSDNIIAGNLIGTDITRQEKLGNRAPGIFLEQDASRNTIGPDNIIAYNGTVGGGGIEIRSVPASANTITANAIFNNQGGGISFDNIPEAYKNSLYGYLSPPVILYFDLAAGISSGVSCKGCIVEIFSTDSQDGKFFEGSVAADRYGNFSFSKGESLSGPFLTATARLPGKNTSEYSQPTAVRSAIRIVLEAIQNEAPLYQTTFDSWDFGEARDEARIENGFLILTSENQQHTGLNLNNLSADKFAVEFEFHLKDAASDWGHCIFETNKDEPFRALGFGFFVNGQANLGHYVSEEEFPDIASSPFEKEIFNRVTIIVLGDQIAAFLNGQIAYATLDPGGNAVYTYQGLAASQKIVCEFDYYKLWDLSKVDFTP